MIPQSSRSVCLLEIIHGNAQSRRSLMFSSLSGKILSSEWSQATALIVFVQSISLGKIRELIGSKTATKT